MMQFTTKQEAGRSVGIANSYGKTDKSILLRETFFARLWEGGGGGGIHARTFLKFYQ